MKRLLVIGAVALMMVSASWGTVTPACTSDTLADYTTPGFACTVGDKVFSDFTATLTGVGVSTAGVGITITPDNNPTLGPGIDLSLTGFSVSSGESMDLKFGYNVNTVSGQPLIEDASIGIAGAANSGSGLVSIGENVCVGGTFSDLGAGTGCSTGSGPPNELELDVQNPGPPAVFFDQKFFAPPVSEAAAFKDISVSGGLSGSASLSSISQNWSEVPEPAGVSFMLGAGLLGLGFLRNKFKKA